MVSEMCFPYEAGSNKLDNRRQQVWEESKRRARKTAVIESLIPAVEPQIY